MASSFPGELGSSFLASIGSHRVEGKKAFDVDTGWSGSQDEDEVGEE